MGTNLANIGLVMGLTSVIRPLSVNARVRRDVPLMLLVTLALLPLAWDRHLSRADGVLLVFLLGLYLVFVFRTSGGETPALLEEVEEYLEAEELEAGRPRLRDLGLMILGCTSLVLAGSAIVRSGVFLATEMGISQLVIGLTAIAVGTSLPELATTLVAVLRLETDLAVGNVIGSNIFNLSAILGTASVLEPIPIAPSILTREFPSLIALSLLLFPLLRSGWRIRRWEGAMLLAAYIAIGGFLL
jgi:cation:H+ antiporter